MRIVMFDREKNVFITNNMQEIPFDLVDGCPRVGSDLIKTELGRYNSINYFTTCPPVTINN